MLFLKFMAIIFSIVGVGVGGVIAVYMCVCAHMCVGAHTHTISGLNVIYLFLGFCSEYFLRSMRPGVFICWEHLGHIYWLLGNETNWAA